jgi:hypothetical protein
MRWRIVSALAVAALAATGCATGGMGSRGGSGDIITAAQIVSSGAQTAYDAVQRLEPSWLTSHGSGSMGAGMSTGSDTPDIYVGGSNVGGVDYLQNVNATDVKEMRFYRPGEAATRFGMGHRAGVIEVTLK